MATGPRVQVHTLIRAIKTLAAKAEEEHATSITEMYLAAWNIGVLCEIIVEKYNEHMEGKTHE